MPSIIIKEYDTTGQRSGTYANFSVVVPGFVKPREWNKDKQAFMYGGKTVCKAASNNTSLDTGKTVFDVNGIYECNNKDDFVNFIGKVEAKSGVSRKATGPKNVVTDTLTEVEFLTFIGKPVSSQNDVDESNSTLYVREARGSASIGKLVDKDFHYIQLVAIADENGQYNWTEDGAELETVADSGSEEPEPQPSSTKYSVYSYNEKTNAFTKVTFDNNYEYSTIDKNNIGNDDEKDYHYGNQIAYELLSLGYTILYVDMTNYSILDLGNDSFWSALKDKSIYDFRYIISGLLGGTAEVNSAMISLAEFNNQVPNATGRGDCTALLDVPVDLYKGRSQADAVPAIQEYIKGSPESTYAAYLAPYVGYASKKMIADYNNCEFPASFHYLACAAKAAENFNEWYAIAGYTRGVSNYTVDYLGCNFGEFAVQALEPRYANDNIDKAVNIIVKIKGSTYLWGNRTAKKLGDENADDGDLKASHFLNVRQLCSTIKKQVYITCRRRSYDPNSDILWINFCNEIKPILEKMKADQGITDYRFIKIKTTQKAMLKAKIRIVPIEAVEDFDISLTLENSLAGNVDVEIEE